MLTFMLTCDTQTHTHTHTHTRGPDGRNHYWQLFGLFSTTTRQRWQRQVSFLGHQSRNCQARWKTSAWVSCPYPSQWSFEFCDIVWNNHQPKKHSWSLMEHPAIHLWVPNLVGGTKIATTQRESFASRRELEKRWFWFIRVEWMQCGGCQNQPYHVALRPGLAATSIQSWCEASGSGNGAGWTPKKISWRKQVAC